MVKHIFKAIKYLLVFLLLPFFAVCWVIMRFGIARPKAHVLENTPEHPDAVWGPYFERVKNGYDELKAMVQENVEITSHDGLRLKGYWISCDQTKGDLAGADRAEEDQMQDDHAEDVYAGADRAGEDQTREAQMQDDHAEDTYAGKSKGTFILAHGYKSDGFTDFSGLAPFLRDRGYNLLLIDQRAQGSSEGKYLGMGVLERYDIRDWIDFVNTRMGEEERIYLGGISMGAATVLMASGLELPENVKGIIADCGFTSPWEEFALQIGQTLHLPAFPFLYGTDLVARLFAGYGFKDYSTLEAMKTNRIPILFVHGDQDTYVPTEMGRRNFEACQAEKKMFIVKGAMHAVSYLVDTEGYQKEVEAFLDEF